MLCSLGCLQASCDFFGVSENHAEMCGRVKECSIAFSLAVASKCVSIRKEWQKMES